MLSRLLNFVLSILGKKKNPVVISTTTSTTTETTTVKYYEATIYGGSSYVTYNTCDLALSVDSLPVKVYLNNNSLTEGTFIYKDPSLTTQLPVSSPNFYSLQLGSTHYAVETVAYAGTVVAYSTCPKGVKRNKSKK